MKKIKEMMLVVFACVFTTLFVSCGATSNILKKDAVSVSGTSTKPKSHSGATVHKGMTQDQVIQIMGRPDSRRTINGVETWAFTRTNTAEVHARGIVGSFIPVVGPLVAYAGAESKNETTVVTFAGSRVQKIDRATNSHQIIRSPF